MAKQQTEATATAAPLAFPGDYRTDAPPSPTSGADDWLLRHEDAATALCVSVRTVYTLIERGHLPAVRVSAGITRIRWSDLQSYIRTLPRE